ncbi:hypothetical protein FOZ63_031260 [Perkinsus olseni]|uniref:EF-hand domain-containing protein n=2 Tax=Perkinsus olseni TaxID=32597 RepID=A0A7J6RZB0_PEROL|nr:hypothetical protein FOZ63_031260 [Perkinsus olseni]
MATTGDVPNETTAQQPTAPPPQQQSGVDLMTTEEAPAPTQEEKLCQIIRRTFDLFDKLGTGTVAPEEVGTIMRYLGQFPTETELVEVVIRELKDHTAAAGGGGGGGGGGTHSITKSTPIGYQQFEKFMLRCLKEHEYDPDDSETLLEAFHLLDPERKGWVDVNQMRDYLGSGHTGFREKEMSEFIEFAQDRDDDENTNNTRLYYEDYVAQLTTNVERHIDNLYRDMTKKE